MPLLPQVTYTMDSQIHCKRKAIQAAETDVPVQITAARGYSLRPYKGRMATVEWTEDLPLGAPDIRGKTARHLNLKDAMAELIPICLAGSGRRPLDASSIQH
jgi:hypothetical protein